MSTDKRIRRVFSVKAELLKKSREAALAAVQIFNSPSVTFKTETYIVLMIIAWTYLLHAYYRGKKVDYRYSLREGRGSTTTEPRTAPSSIGSLSGASARNGVPLSGMSCRT